MALTGTYSRSLDEKRRLAIPRKLREQFGGEKIRELFVAPGTDKSLCVYSPDTFESLAARLAERTTNHADIRNYLRLFYARAEEVTLDGQSRIRIPDRLAELAGLQRDVVLLGVHDHAEIWERSAWEEFLNGHSAGFDELATRAFEL